MNLPRRISCNDCHDLGSIELKTLTNLNLNIVVNTKKKAFATQKPNKTKRIVPGNTINNEGINTKLKRVTKTALSLGPIKPK